MSLETKDHNLTIDNFAYIGIFMLVVVIPVGVLLGLTLEPIMEFTKEGFSKIAENKEEIEKLPENIKEYFIYTTSSFITVVLIAYAIVLGIIMGILFLFADKTSMYFGINTEKYKTCKCCKKTMKNHPKK